MKRKDMKRHEWRRILEKEYYAAPCVFENRQGTSSVLIIKRVSEPMMICYEHGEVTIANEGDTWLQLALRDTYVWVTAMFDREHKLQQIYFDITNGNCFEDETNPTFEDLYLDIVLEADGTLHVLDRNELDEALVSGKIGESTYQRAVKEGEDLYQYLRENWQTFAAFCHAEMIRLRGMHKNGQNGTC